MTDAATRAQALLKDHRDSIDRLDAILVYTLAERFKQTQAVGTLKAEHDAAALRPRPRSNARSTGWNGFRKKPISTPNLPRNS